MFRIILLCTVLGYISAQSVLDPRYVSSTLTEVPDTVVTDQHIGIWVAVVKLMRDTSLTKEKRVEKIKQLLSEAPLRYVQNLVELSDNEWKLVNAASPKVKQIHNKSYDLKSDPKLYKMDPDQRRVLGEKLYNTLSNTEKRELEKIRIKTMEKLQELRRKQG